MACVIQPGNLIKFKDGALEEVLPTGLGQFQLFLYSDDGSHTGRLTVVALNKGEVDKAIFLFMKAEVYDPYDSSKIFVLFREKIWYAVITTPLLQLGAEHMVKL